MGYRAFVVGLLLGVDTEGDGGASGGYLLGIKKQPFSAVEINHIGAMNTGHRGGGFHAR